MGLFGGGADAPEVEKDTLRVNTVAKVVDLISEGPISAVRELYFDDTPLTRGDGGRNFDGVEWEWRPGWPDQEPLHLASEVESEIEVNQALRQGLRVTRRVNDPSVNRVRLRLSLPQGLYRVDNTGDQRAATVELDLYLGVGGATPSLLQHVAIQGKASSAYDYQLEFDLPQGGPPWDIAWQRTSPDEPYSKEQARGWATTWASYTEITSIQLAYRHSAIVATKFDGKKFGGSVPKRSFLVDGRVIWVPDNYDPNLRTYSSAVWSGRLKPAFSDNPAWVLYDILIQKRYGLGRFIPEALLDKWSIYAIGRYCDERVPDGKGGTEPRFRVAIQLTEQRGAWAVLSDLASVFRGLVYYGGGLITAMADRPLEPVWLFNSANVVDGAFTYAEAALDARHSVVSVQWRNPERDYETDVEVVEDRDLILRYGYRTKEITSFGCTSRGQARRAGLWILATERYESRTVRFQAGLEAAWLTPGQIVAISDPRRAGERMAGRCSPVGNTLNQLQLDAPVTIAPGSTYTVMVAMPDGSVATRNLTDPAGSTDLLHLAADLPALPQPGALFVVQGADIHAALYRILAITEDEPHAFTFDCVAFEPQKFALIENGVAIHEAPIVRWTGDLWPPSNLQAQDVLYKSRGTVAARLDFGWSPSPDPRVELYEVWYIAPATSDWRRYGLTDGVTVALEGAIPGRWQLRVRSVAALANPSAWVSLSYDYGGLLTPPPDVEGFSVNASLGMLICVWTPSPVLDLDHYQIRFLPFNAPSLTWEAAQPLAETIPATASSWTVLAGSGLYFIKAFDSYGNESRHAATAGASIEAIADRIELGSLTETAPFAGVATGLVADDLDRLILDRDDDGLFLANGGYYEVPGTITLPQAGTVEVRAIITALGERPGYTLKAWGPLATVKPLAGARSGSWRNTLEISTSDDGASWAAWAPLQGGLATFLEARFRLRLESLERGSVSPALTSYTITALAAGQLLNGQDITVPAEGMRIAFDPPFLTVPVVAITGQNLSAGDTYVLTDLDRTGFAIQWLDAGGDGVERSMDYLARGYGRENPA